MSSEHERFLAEEHFKAPVVVTDYPRDIKAFYMRLNDDERTVAAMDVLAPGIGEIIGGSQREERLDVLDARMDNTLKDTLWWYRDLRRYGTVPHAGFGLGFERLVAYITGMDNVRDVIPFPRTPGNADF
jgi:asparaginyl-tRNA synthetase